VSAAAVRRAAAGKGASRRVQTLVIFLVLLASTGAATVGLALLAADSGAPFQRSFAAQNGADVVAGVNPARATPAQLAATSRLPGVTQAAGPFQLTSAALDSGPAQFGTVTVSVAGRLSPGGPVDDLTLQAGRWARRPGEIVIASDLGRGPDTQFTVPIGGKVTVPTAPGDPTLTVVGLARSITSSAGAWVVPAELPALRTAGAPAAAEMLYRFRQAGSAAQIQADVKAVAAALPAGAITGKPASWLDVSSEATGNSSIIAPFVMAFAIMGLAMSVLIVANVVSGLVVAGYRRIGVLKSIGLTPAQVVIAYLVRVGIPAAAGCLLGTVLGNVLAAPVLSHSATVYGVGSQPVPPWVDAVIPLGMLALTGLAALLPAIRASRLSAVQAIALGQAPTRERGHAANRLLGRARLPRPMAIGLAAPFSRPARTSAMLAAIAFGATAVIFAVALDSSLAKAATGTANAHGPGQVQVGTANGNPLQGGQDRRVQAAISAQPGTARYVAEAFHTIGVSGLTLEADAGAFKGDATWTGYDMVSGHWYSGRGEADVNTAFLNQTGLSVGDTIPVTSGGKPLTVRVAGEIFDPDRQPVLITSWQTLGGSAAGLTVDQYAVGLRPGVSPDAYANSLGNALGNAFSVSTDGGGKFFGVATSLIAMLTLMIAVVAGLGVLNTVLLGTRERVHDLGVFKALGMTPRVLTGMVVCWVTVPALAAAVIAVPAATLLHSATLRAMANAAGTAIPSSFGHVFGPAEIALLALSGLLIAMAGALLPGVWAARSRTAAVLRAE
jgi:putative ABC transport system permease protein